MTGASFQPQFVANIERNVALCCQNGTAHFSPPTCGQMNEWVGEEEARANFSRPHLARFRVVFLPQLCQLVVWTGQGKAPGV